MFHINVQIWAPQAFSLISSSPPCLYCDRSSLDFCRSAAPTFRSHHSPRLRFRHCCHSPAVPFDLRSVLHLNRQPHLQTYRSADIVPLSLSMFFWQISSHTPVFFQPTKEENRPYIPYSKDREHDFGAFLQWGPKATASLALPLSRAWSEVSESSIIAISYFTSIFDRFFLFPFPTNANRSLLGTFPIQAFVFGCG